MAKPRPPQLIELEFDEYLGQRIDQLGLACTIADLRGSASAFEKAVGWVDIQANVLLVLGASALFVAGSAIATIPELGIRELAFIAALGLAACALLAAGFRRRKWTHYLGLAGVRRLTYTERSNIEDLMQEVDAGNHTVMRIAESGAAAAATPVSRRPVDLVIGKDCLADRRLPFPAITRRTLPVRQENSHVVFPSPPAQPPPGAAHPPDSQGTSPSFSSRWSSAFLPTTKTVPPCERHCGRSFSASAPASRSSKARTSVSILKVRNTTAEGRRFDAGAETIILRIMTVAFAEPREVHVGRGRPSNVPQEPLRQLRGRVVGFLAKRDGRLTFSPQEWRLPVLGASVYPLSDNETVATIGATGIEAEQIRLSASTF